MLLPQTCVKLDKSMGHATPLIMSKRTVLFAGVLSQGFRFWLPRVLSMEDTGHLFISLDSAFWLNITPGPQQRHAFLWSPLAIPRPQPAWLKAVCYQPGDPPKVSGNHSILPWNDELFNSILALACHLIKDIIAFGLKGHDPIWEVKSPPA